MNKVAGRQAWEVEKGKCQIYGLTGLMTGRKKKLNSANSCAPWRRGIPRATAERRSGTIGAKRKKCAKRGISNLYLLKEAEDDNDGITNAYYAYSITDGVISDEDFEKIRAVCAENLTTGEMRAVCSFCKPNEWWDTNPNFHTKQAEKGETDSFYSFLIAQLFPAGILLTSQSLKKKEARSLACSAIAWGLKESGLFKKGAYMSYTIDNELL